MTNHFDALFPYTIDRLASSPLPPPPPPPPPSSLTRKQFLLMCPFCDATFTDETIWRSHATDHFFNNTRPVFPCRRCHEHFPNAQLLRQHFDQHTATQSTQTHDAANDEALESCKLLSIKNEVPDGTSEAVDNTHFDEFYDDDYLDNVSLQQVKLEPTTALVTMQEQLLSLPKAFVALERLDAGVVQKHVTQQVVKHRGRRTKDVNKTSKCAASAKFAYPTAPIQCAICCETVCDLFPTEAMDREEFDRTRNVMCRLCGFSIRQLASVPLHYRRVHMNESDRLTSMVACNSCVANKLASLPKHFKGTDDTWIKCELCPKMHRTQLSLRMHMRNDHNDRCVYVCPHCARLIIGRSRFKKHIYMSHAQIARPQTEGHFQCEHCGKVMKMRGSIIAHLQTHFSQQRYPCTLCPIVLKTAGNLKQHMWQHAGRKNITCDVCGRRFGRTANWRFHMRSHTGERPFACEECGRRFSSKSNMMAHMRTHTGEKPYACEQCDKRYREVSDLRRHKRVHGGVEKTHKCGVCDKRYYEAKCLRAHLMSSHKMVGASMKSEC